MGIHRRNGRNYEDLEIMKCSIINCFYHIFMQINGKSINDRAFNIYILNIMNFKIVIEIMTNVGEFKFLLNCLKLNLRVDCFYVYCKVQLLKIWDCEAELMFLMYGASINL